VNILTNARDASTHNDNVTIATEVLDHSIRVHVVDQGHGIPTGNPNRIFEPFFTTKDPDKGTGLGLAIVSNIMEEHHGTITADRVSDAGGTRVTLRLPIYYSDFPLASLD